MRLLGPVFWYDLVRVARRQPLALWRAAYGLALLAALFLLYATALPEAWLGGHVKPKDAAAFATRFFDVFTAVQFAVVMLITPALTANAVAEEKGHNTLLFLLTTHLTNREIIVGKLLTRLLLVGLLVLTGLPVLAIMQLMGGVELSLVLSTFAALAMTALSLGSLGLFCGVFVRKHQNAAWRAYQILIVYLALSFLSIWYYDLPTGRRAVWAMTGRINTRWVTGAWSGSLTATPEPSAWEQIQTCFSTPNPFFAHLRLAEMQNTGTALNDALAEVLRDYVIGHGALTLLLGGLAIIRLRTVAARQTGGITHKKKLILRAAPHPPVRERPVLWKEIYCESRPRRRWLALFFSRWFFYASFFPGWFYLVLSLDGSTFVGLATRTGFLLRYPGTLVVGLLCLRVGMQAARSIGGERERQTLDSLLTTQLTPDEIVRQKWWGSLLAGRRVFFWLLIQWGLATAFLALHWVSLAALVVETLVFAGFAVSLGMYCGARCATTRHAITATILIGLIGTTLVPWGVGAAATAVLGMERPPTTPVYLRYPPSPPWPETVGHGMIPPWVLIRSIAPYDLYDYSEYYYSGAYDPRIPDGEEMASIVAGLLVYFVAGLLLAAAAHRRFRRSLAGSSTVGRGRLGVRPASRASPGPQMDEPIAPLPLAD
jgi:ABC-type transport system involved in multi-copper enzyme maturation permease subunit